MMKNVLYHGRDRGGGRRYCNLAIWLFSNKAR